MTELPRACGCLVDPGVFGHCWPEHDQAELEARLRAAAPGEWLGILAEHEQAVTGRALEGAAWAERDLDLDLAGPQVAEAPPRVHDLTPWFFPVEFRRRRATRRR